MSPTTIDDAIVLSLVGVAVAEIGLALIRGWLEGVFRG